MWNEADCAYSAVIRVIYPNLVQLNSVMPCGLALHTSSMNEVRNPA